MSSSALTPPSASAPPRAARLSDVSSHQWKSGIAAWLGWFFDGLDMHLYLLIALPFVAELMHASIKDPAVARTSGIIQAAFLAGWALGGGFFGRIGDLLGRSAALSLTILTYALFTGLSFFAHTWWELMIFRFVAALGIGGEWAVGASLISETWPGGWRPWLAAILQSGVNLGVLVACAVRAGLVEFGFADRCVFLVGILPALVVLWIRRQVPEPQEWHAAKLAAKGPAPGVAELFRPGICRVTVLTIVVCASSLTAWWSFMFWGAQHFRTLPDVANWTDAQRSLLTTVEFFLVIGVSIPGNFFAGWLAKRMGYRNAISGMFIGFFVAMFGAYVVPRDYFSLLFWTSAVGFFSGVFGLFTMYLPQLFPTLLRTTGAGFAYNIGRLAAAAGSVIFGLTAKVQDFRVALFCGSFLFLPAIVVALMLPDLRD